MAAGNSIDKKDHIDTSGFYIEIGTAQVIIQRKCVIRVNYGICFHWEARSKKRIDTS